jgi:hypothetical protein
VRGHSSAGRASALQAEGRRFEPAWLHHRDDEALSRQKPIKVSESFFVSFFFFLSLFFLVFRSLKKWVV